MQETWTGHTQESTNSNVADCQDYGRRYEKAAEDYSEHKSKPWLLKYREQNHENKMKGRREHKRQIGKGARYLLPTKEKWTKFRYKLCLNDISLVPVNCKRERNKTGHLTCEQVTHEEVCQTKQPSHTAHLAPSYRPSRKKKHPIFKGDSVGLLSFQKRAD